MKPSVLAVLCCAASAAWAQPKPAPLSPDDEQAIAAFAVRPPDENSPFFANRVLARQEMSLTARREIDGAVLPNGTAQYPRTSGGEATMLGTVGRFFTDMFASVRLGRLRAPETVSQMKLDPAEFSLADRREVEVTYVVRNDSNTMLRLEYPTTQRIDIVTTDSAGTVLDRWSDDRAFQPEEGIVIINPRERISYTEKVPTRDMKAEQEHKVSAEVVGYPEYGANVSVRPSP